MEQQAVHTNKAMPDGDAPVANSRDYLVTVMKHIDRSGRLYAFVARVSVSESIQWVRAHIGELTEKIISCDTMLQELPGPVVALYIEAA